MCVVRFCCRSRLTGRDVVCDDGCMNESAMSEIFEDGYEIGWRSERSAEYGPVAYPTGFDSEEEEAQFSAGFYAGREAARRGWH